MNLDDDFLGKRGFVFDNLLGQYPTNLLKQEDLMRPEAYRKQCPGPRTHEGEWLEHNLRQLYRQASGVVGSFMGYLLLTIIDPSNSRLFAIITLETMLVFMLIREIDPYLWRHQESDKTSTTRMARIRNWHRRNTRHKPYS